MAAPMAMTCSRKDLTLTLLPDAALVAKARASLSAVMALWEADELTETAKLLMTELVTNALQHSETGNITVHATWSRPCLRMEVQDGDPSSRPPVAEIADPDTVSGRGLFLVDALSERWGTAFTPTGKHVWFELRASTPAPRISDPVDTTSSACLPEARRRRYAPSLTRPT